MFSALHFKQMVPFDFPPVFFAVSLPHPYLQKPSLRFTPLVAGDLSWPAAAAAAGVAAGAAAGAAAARAGARAARAAGAAAAAGGVTTCGRG